MKCYIRRCKRNGNGETEWLDTYYNKCLGFQNHWVSYRQEAKLFDSFAAARKEIKENKLKNCDVYKK